jgi:peptidoglycan-N-acetylglucosamine deacetylase
MVEILAGVAGMAAVTAAGYQTMSPKGQWYGRTFTGLPGGTQKIALTYDDGPNDTCTPKLLEALDKHAVRATFFMIGRFARQRPKLVDAVSRAGHAVGNHTCNHPNLIFASSERTRMELNECQQALRDVIGEDPVLFRPPWGGRRPQTLLIARSLNLTPIMWNATGYDWKPLPADRIVTLVSRQIRGGDVILLHDGSHANAIADRSQTVIATTRLIEKYQGEGYEFVTIPEMLAEADNTTAASSE